ncbi:uncharacterized protein LOC123407933 [Hordeum vulgare subsp. vulgare]|uniref:Uncharacterized protein n=1 Tax=Hordeum vulgare subsp. vulgare TaxID=112509 RepID=M0VVG4_HORVV|nr:uncharacterized protein LOC123407933 [Hordeum vulgare subsp. vulgare]
MGKQPGNTGPSSASRSANQAVSLREETSGKAQVDVPSLLRVQHLQRLGAWASGEAGVGSIGALLGYRLATNAEAAAIPIGASTFVCQRCESILQPGFNCTIRIKNNKKKAKRRKKSNPGQNSVVYACHFCGDQNLIRGSGKGFVKGLLSSRKPVSVMLKGDNISVPTVTAKNATEHSVTAGSQLEPSRLKTSTLEKDKRGNGPKSYLPEDSKMEKGAAFSMVDRGQLADAHEETPQKIEVESTHDKRMTRLVPVSSKNITICESDVTSQAEFLLGSNFVTPRKSKLVEVTVPIASAEALETGSTLSSKGQSCGSAAGKIPGSYSKSASNSKSVPGDSTQAAGSSRKRARKGWTTLKQIAEKDELERKQKMDNFVIPFFMQ